MFENPLATAYLNAAASFLDLFTSGSTDGIDDDVQFDIEIAVAKEFDAIDLTAHETSFAQCDDIDGDGAIETVQIGDVYDSDIFRKNVLNPRLGKRRLKGI